MTEPRPTSLPWLERYATGYHSWQRTSRNSRVIYSRPLGVVEQLFDLDGIDFEGRADITSWLKIELRHELDHGAFRKRLRLAWAALRVQHVMLYAKTVEHASHDSGKVGECRFVVEPPVTVEEARDAAADDMTFLTERGTHPDAEEFYHHLMNTARALDATRSLSRLFVLPERRLDHGKTHLDIMLVTAHCVSDGLSVHAWMSHFIDLLNMPLNTLSEVLQTSLDPAKVPSRLPPAQEDLYPPPPRHIGSRKGSLARSRWFWAITLVLRHIRHPAPASFPNPLRRTQPLVSARRLPPTFSSILDYSRTPPLNTFSSRPQLSPRATHRLQRLCWGAGVSIGAGGFALVAMSMMVMQERQDPHSTLPFVSSFPVNPRPFLRTDKDGGGAAMRPESLMLAFSDGIVFPFLPSYIPLEKRFVFLARRAHRQLVTFQKNRQTTPGTIEALGARSPAQLLPQLYLMTLERVEARLPPHRRRGYDPQGAFPAKIATGMVTCGVSSMGPRWHLLDKGRYDLDDTSKDFVADFRGLSSTVRVRDGEFLVGSSSDRDTLGFGVSGDGNAIDEQKVKEWERVIVTLLEGEDEGKGSAAVSAAGRSRL